MSMPWHQDVYTFRCYCAKVDLFERIIIAGNEQNEAEAVLAQSLLDLLNITITIKDGKFIAQPNIAEVVLPLLEEAQFLGHTDVMHNRLSVEQNAILAFRKLSELLPDARIEIPNKPITHKVGGLPDARQSKANHHHPR